MGYGDYGGYTSKNSGPLGGFGLNSGGSSSNPSGSYSYVTEQQQAAQKAAEEQRAASWANADANAARYGNGYQLGNSQFLPDLYSPSALRPDQTVKERISEQRRNFFYADSPTGREDAIAALRGNVDPYTQALAQSGTGFMGQASVGAKAFMPGVQGTYGTAGTLADLAMRGPGPSMAQAQLEAQTQRNMRDAVALAGSGRGQGGGAEAFRMAGAQQARLAGESNAQAAILRAQEEDAWRRTQAGMLGQAGQLYNQGGDLAARYAAGMGGLGLGAQQGAAQTQLGVEQGANSINMGALQGSTGYEQLLNQIYGIDRNVGVQNAQLAQQQQAATWGAIGTGIGTGATLALAASDIRGKTDIAPAPELSGGFTLPEPTEYELPAGPEPPKSQEDIRKERERQALLAQLGAQTGQLTTNLGLAMSDIRAKTAIAPAGALSAVEQTNPWSYRYKDPSAVGATAGTHYGPMAQELAQTPVGRSTLVQMPNGQLGVDTGRLALVNTAAQAAKAKHDRVQARGFSQRLDELERKLRGAA